MASPDRSLLSQPARRRPVFAALLPLALALPALADRPENRAAELQQQEAMALARLSTPDLRNYFEIGRAHV